ncbi:NAD(P)/FAD-dependent oxidoreductase [Microbispora triticiradicis]|uniref:FAD-dependent oxidoreductase n=2 Tax=Microbispora TaxID=2005 RepID=A0ABY3LXS8_9ACTN|nr:MULTISPECIES: NAD(P)/FAD-dependent oxidoreductase [Microbispora]TLP56301.1 FAD-dependent oxidoreductase [Microbispora fusca]TYB59047.1 FAD-dependent oxidoreductase [Microbispora tritici]
MPQPATVIVVGAGLAGLACAVHLRRAGVAVRVLEASDGVGGRIRTDIVDGFRLDRGFQVFNTGYPEAARILDIPALRLRPFTSGVIVFRDGRHERVTLPWRHPRQALSGLFARVGTPVDKAVLAAVTTRDLLLPGSLVRRRGGAERRTTEEELRHWGASPEVVENLFRPFLSGVVLERELETSGRIFHLLWRSFVRGVIGLPALGMGRIPEQLAGRLPPDAVRLETPVGALTPTGVALGGGGEMEAAAVVVAADPATAGRLLPGLPVPAMRSVTTFYHAAPASPLWEPTQIVDAEGVITDTIVVTDAAPEYSSDGRALISTSVLGVHGDRDEPRVRDRLARIYGDTSSWEHVATYAIEAALPAMPPPMPLRRPVRVPAEGSGARRYVCGDHRDTGSIQGALVSGRRAARAVLEDLRTRPVAARQGRTARDRAGQA